MRKFLSSTKRSMTEADRSVLMLVINQWRERVGVMFGDPRTTPGGKGKNYTYMVRAEVTREEWIKDGDEQVGQTIKIQTIKNKTFPPRRTATVDFYFADCDGHPQGSYDYARELWDIGIERDVIERHGAWYHFGKHKWNGKDAVWTAMQTDESLVSAIDTAVRREVLGIEPPPAASTGTRKRKVARK
jgi:recombination protein RecA